MPQQVRQLDAESSSDDGDASAEDAGDDASSAAGTGSVTGSDRDGSSDSSSEAGDAEGPSVAIQAQAVVVNGRPPRPPGRPEEAPGSSGGRSILKSAMKPGKELRIGAPGRVIPAVQRWSSPSASARMSVDESSSHAPALAPERSVSRGKSSRASGAG